MKTCLNKSLSLVDIKLVILIITSLHIFTLSFPSKAFVFDEAYYIPAARDFLNGIGSNPEHPFLGKAWIALGISLFGDNWFGWRIMPTIFNILSLIVFYHISKTYLSKKLATYSTILLGLDVMFFVHGSLALLEIPSMFFAFLSFWLYINRKGKKILQIPSYYWLSAICMGLAFLSKETAAFFVITIMFLYIVRIKYTRYSELRSKVIRGSLLLIVLASVYFVPVTIYDQIYKPSSRSEVIISKTELQLTDKNGIVTSTTTITNTTTRKEIIDEALEHLIFTVTYASGLRITNESEVNPGNYAWNWILPVPSFSPMPYYIENAEVRHTTKANDEIIGISVETRHPIAWYGTGTLPIWWSIWLIIPFTIYNVWKKRPEFDLLILIWIASTYLPMLYTSGVIGRIVYPFYFIQTIPALALGIPYLISSTFKNKMMRNTVLLIFMITIIAYFIMYFPVRVNEF